MDEQEYHWDRLDEFAGWLGDWLGAVENGWPAYYNPEYWPSGPDRILKQPQGSGRRDLAIWICTGTLHAHFGFQSTVQRLDAAVRAQPDLRHYDWIIASPDDLRDPTLDRVDILDAKRWLSEWELHRRWAEGIADRLKRLLDETPPGGDGKDFQLLVCDVFRFLFYPALNYPRLESPSLIGTQRRDILFAFGTAPSSIWPQLAHRMNASNLVVEAKNWSPRLPPDMLMGLRAYLKPYSPGQLGVMATRIGLTDQAWKQVRDYTREGIAILPIDDPTMIQMIDATMSQRYGARHNGAEDVIASLYADVFRG